MAPVATRIAPALSLLATLALPACDALSPPACPGQLRDLPGGVAKGGTCLCPVGGGSGSIWGSGIYTADSELCTAAIHAGAVQREQGGKVRIEPRPGCDAYQGTSQNGVSSGKWGAFSTSFVFADAAPASCWQRPADLCPDTFAAAVAAAPVTQAGELSCTCEATASSGAVWGTDVYTHDSSICRAALHAGALPAQPGGRVRVKGGPGCARYVGSERNGITSSNWGAFPASFYFPARGDGRCYTPPAGSCPSTFAELPEQARASEYSCACDAVMARGAVWGTDVYTADSSLCAAAVHSGAVSMPPGGVVTVAPTAGCDSYSGSARFGVESRGFGAFAASFYFPGFALPRCVQPKAEAR